MSLDREIEDSLQACREIEKFLTQPQEIPEIPEALNPEPDPEPALESVLEPEQGTEEKSEPETEGVLEPELEADPDWKKDPVFEIDKEATQEAAPDPGREKEEKRKGQARGRHSMLRTGLSVVICIFTALILSLLITKFVAHHTSVEGSSMEPSLSNGDQIIVENISYYIDEPERFDVVVFPNKDGVNYIKRIIGLPGEEVWIFDGQIYIDGELLIEDYGDEPIQDPGIAAGDFTLGEEEYFVLGDNRNASIDSRRADVGPVKRDQIKGKAWLRFFPFNKIGMIGS